MVAEQFAIAVVVSAGGAVLDHRALADLPLARLVDVELGEAPLATCAAMQLAHTCSVVELRTALAAWASARGWSLAVAPLRGTG